MDAGIWGSKLMEPRRAIPKFSSAKAGVVPTFVFVGKAEGRKWHCLDDHPLLRKVLSTGKISAQLWELIHKRNAEWKNGEGNAFHLFAARKVSSFAFLLYPNAWRNFREQCWVWILNRRPIANLIYLTVPSTELEGISRIGSVPAT